MLCHVDQLVERLSSLARLWIQARVEWRELRKNELDGRDRWREGWWEGKTRKVREWARGGERESRLREGEKGRELARETVGRKEESGKDEERDGERGEGR